MGWLQLDRAKQTSKYDLIHEVMYNPFFAELLFVLCLILLRGQIIL